MLAARRDHGPRSSRVRRGAASGQGDARRRARGRVVLELHDVHAVYGRSHVLHGVTLSARAGEVVSLLGRNGAGKSTTLKAIVGLVEVTRGDIVLDGRVLRGLPTHTISRAGIGWVPEDRRIFGDLTVREN